MNATSTKTRLGAYFVLITILTQYFFATAAGLDLTTFPTGAAAGATSGLGSLSNLGATIGGLTGGGQTGSIELPLVGGMYTFWITLEIKNIFHSLENVDLTETQVL